MNPKFIAKAAVHKTQRNGTSRLVIAGTDHKGSGDQNNEIYRSNSFQFDNAFVSRPIPQADRSSWFLSMVSGSTPQTNTYQQYLISGSRYPGDIYNLTSSAGLIEGAKASNAVIAINSLVVSQWNGRTLDVFDALGNQLLTHFLVPLLENIPGALGLLIQQMQDSLEIHYKRFLMKRQAVAKQRSLTQEPRWILVEEIFL